MSKRNWPDHIGIGRVLKYGEHEVRVVDVKKGPMLVDTSTMNQQSAVISETLRLRISLPSGKEQWLPPMDGNSFVGWCERQDAQSRTALAKANGGEL